MCQYGQSILFGPDAVYLCCLSSSEDVFVVCEKKRTWTGRERITGYIALLLPAHPTHHVQRMFLSLSEPTVPLELMEFAPLSTRYADGQVSGSPYKNPDSYAILGWVEEH